MGQVWGIGKRKFGKDWGRRIWLFDRLVWSVLGYGVENWGWRGREGIERLQEKFLMDIQDKQIYTRAYGEERATEGDVKRKSREGMEIREKFEK